MIPRNLMKRFLKVLIVIGPNYTMITKAKVIKSPQVL